eukprot:scaffold244225_cov45-Attheya_sp.AAC.1
MMKLVMKTGRITSVISAPANNEVAFKEKHKGFIEYNHRSSMTNNELIVTFDEIKHNIQDVVKNSGGVPLYAFAFARDPQIFQAEVNESVNYSLYGLYDLSRWTRIQDCNRMALLSSVSSSDGIKFQLGNGQVDIDASTKYESEIIRPTERNIRPASYRIKPDSITLSYRTFLRSSVFPKLTRASRNCMYIPFDPNFPAVDFIVKHDDNVFGIQAHVNSHDDVVASFVGLCKEADWFHQFETVYLLYLSPEDAVTDLIRKVVEPPKYTSPITRSMAAEAEAEAEGREYAIVRRAIRPAMANWVFVAILGLCNVITAAPTGEHFGRLVRGGAAAGSAVLQMTQAGLMDHLVFFELVSKCRGPSPQIAAAGNHNVTHQSFLVLLVPSYEIPASIPQLFAGLSPQPLGIGPYAED